MAHFLKSGARKPLAEGRVSFSWGSALSGLPADANYRIRVATDTHAFSCEMKPKECLEFVSWFAGRETHNPVPSYASDKRSLVEKLRALADKLEAEGNLSRMELTG